MCADEVCSDERMLDFRYEVMVSCWDSNIEVRPSINSVFEKLTHLYNDLFTKDLYIVVNDNMVP